MNKSIDITYSKIEFILDKIIPISHIRGWFISQYRDFDQFHNHDESGKSLFRYPEVQYRKINDMYQIIVYNENINLKNLITIDSMLDSVILNMSISDNKTSLGMSELMRRVSFATPYIPVQHKESKAIKSVLIGNIIETAKYFGYTITEQILVDDIYIKRKNIIHYHGIPFNAYDLSFYTNCILPRDGALGKHKSIGYGVLA